MLSEHEQPYLVASAVRDHGAQREGHSPILDRELLDEHIDVMVEIGIVEPQRLAHRQRQQLELGRHTGRPRRLREPARGGRDRKSPEARPDEVVSRPLQRLLVSPAQGEPSASRGLAAVAKQLQGSLPHPLHVIGREQPLDRVFPEPMSRETSIVLDTQQRHPRDQAIEVAVVARDAMQILSGRGSHRRDCKEHPLIPGRQRADDLLPQELGRRVGGRGKREPHE